MVKCEFCGHESDNGESCCFERWEAATDAKFSSALTVVVAVLVPIVLAVLVRLLVTL